MPRLTPETIVAVRNVIWNGFAALIAALIAAFLAWQVTASTNADLAIQQQEMTTVNQFDETGADLDGSMSDFIDSIVDGDVRPGIRKSLRTSISLHAAKSQRLGTIVGEQAVADYTEGLAKLRQLADEADDVETAMTAAQIHADILANKKQISDIAWQRIAKS